MSHNKYHFIGIGGIGMSALAAILLDQGKKVSGSDLAVNERIQKLREKGASIAIGHSADNVPVDAMLVVSSDIPAANPELEFARKLKMTISHRSDLLHHLMSEYKPLLVTGSHGKTTTASLLASVLAKSALDPAFALGGVLLHSGLNASHRKSEFFVAEADESDGSFLKYEPFGAILTNIDNDHMNYYASKNALQQAFCAFSKKIQSDEHFFFCNDDPSIQDCCFKGISYGFKEAQNLKGSRFIQEASRIYFDAEFRGRKYQEIELSLTGIHNALNALAVFGLCLTLGVEESLIRSVFSTFKGVKRRLEKIGELNGVLVLDDYGHHPTEIAATLKGVKEAMPDKRLIAIFQPHRFTRTRDCWDQFASCFFSADEVFITDIYSANEEPIAGIDALSLAGSINYPTQYLPRQQISERIYQITRPHDVIVTIGAGDIYKEGPKILAKISDKA